MGTILSRSRQARRCLARRNRPTRFCHLRMASASRPPATVPQLELTSLPPPLQLRRVPRSEVVFCGLPLGHDISQCLVRTGPLIQSALHSTPSQTSPRLQELLARLGRFVRRVRACLSPIPEVPLAYGSTSSPRTLSLSPSEPWDEVSSCSSVDEPL